MNSIRTEQEQICCCWCGQTKCLALCGANEVCCNCSIGQKCYFCRKVEK